MSKNKTILFRADSSSKIGTGHIMRDLVLAQKYAKKGAKIIFASRNLEGNISQKIVDKGYELVTLESHSKKELKKIIKKRQVAMVVFDHYGIDAKYEKYIKEKTGVKILSFDDTYKKHYCDILLNHNLSADAKRYKKLVPKGCKIRCGKRYTLLRDEFYKAKKKKFKRSNVPTIFIAMGGADTAELNLKILKTLKKFPKIKKIVVTTTANKNLKKLQKFTQDERNIELHINSNRVAKLMAQSDFAIVTPSVIANELVYLKKKFLAIRVVQNNQSEMLKYLQKNGYATMEKFNKKELFNILKKVL